MADTKIITMVSEPAEPISSSSSKKTIKVKKIVKKSAAEPDVSEKSADPETLVGSCGPGSGSCGLLAQSLEAEPETLVENLGGSGEIGGAHRAPKISPDYLARVNAHERDQYISFDEGPHVYTVHGDTTFTSVTTWNHSHFEKFDADAIARKIVKKPQWKKDPEYKYYQKSVEEIIAMWSSTEASEAGTKMHYDIECYYNGLDVKNDSIEFNYFLEFARDYAHLEAYRTEWCVYYEELKLSGSIDMVFRDKNTGEFYIYDWKRSKGINFEGFGGKMSHVHCIKHLDDANFWHYSLQLNTYRAILEEKYDMKIAGMYLIVLHPDNLCGSYDRIQCHDLRTEIADLFRLRRQQVLDGTDVIKANAH